MSRKYKFHDNDKLYFIKDQQAFDNYLRYIHDNPVAAGFVSKPEIGNTVLQEIFVD